jgi:hypothetical protein
VGGELTEQEALVLSEWYAGQARLIAAFPSADLKAVEPPLWSIPGPAVGPTSA